MSNSSAHTQQILVTVVPNKHLMYVPIVHPLTCVLVRHHWVQGIVHAINYRSTAKGTLAEKSCLIRHANYHIDTLVITIIPWMLRMSQPSQSTTF